VARYVCAGEEDAMSSTAQNHPLQLRTAYGVCRHITRSSAKNFYYGFLVLPARKRNALSAVYAFMRHADDISDDPTLPAAERKRRLSEFLEGYHKAAAGAQTDDPVFMALRDSQERYKIPIELLDMLVAGTCMDLEESRDVPKGTADAPLVAYETFADLYGYCYHVASVVGLICIRIFGYRDPAAEALAEHVGIAFQLTNILRDVKEDANMGRVYIPREDLDRFGISVQELSTGSNREKLRPLFEMQAQRARDFYKAADQLIPLIDEVSQPALWTMVQIYKSLLEKIVAGNFDIFGPRVRLTVAEKLRILYKGFVRKIT
jgi:15-cis-phytoene synthase